MEVKLINMYAGKLWIGTSNAEIRGNKSTFPREFQAKSRLHYYATIFNSVEINRSFYTIPLFATYRRWAMDVPEDFRFTLKFSKEVTHVKELKADFLAVEKFMRAADGIENKKGCLLIQFPGKISIKYFSEVEKILTELCFRDSQNEWKKVVEFRNADWYIGETWELLDHYNASVVLHDKPKAKLSEVRGKVNHLYFRFHGPKGDYRESYSDDYIKVVAENFRVILSEGKEVYCYFNNTAGNAYENALLLKSLLL